MKQNNRLEQEHYALYLAFCAGEPRASMKLYDALQGRLYAYLSRCFAGKPIDDYTQTTWLKLFVSYCKQSLTNKNIGGLLMRIGRNVGYDALDMDETRKALNHCQSETHNTENISDLKPEPADWLEECEQITLFKQELSTLPKKQRIVLEFWLLGHAVAEIAAITGDKEDAVRWQLHTAKAKLKKVLPQVMGDDNE